MGVNWTEQEAAHLLSRTAFWAGPEEVKAVVVLGREEAVRRLLEGEPLTGSVFQPVPLQQIGDGSGDLDEDQIVDQQAYWIYMMAYTHAPLLEKMTLFWHGHFATSYQRVRDAALMLQQKELFRKYALGDFGQLLLEVGKNPAMMIYLDASNNKKGTPNENYARESLELFALGIGNYTEDDVREAARALTGWTYEKAAGELKFRRAQHDDGTKTILGQTGNWNEQDYVDILLKQEALPRFIARKLLVYFLTEQPEEALIDKVAGVFRRSYSIKETMEFLLLGDDFYRPEYRGVLVKTPVEYVAGSMRALGLSASKDYAKAARRMGQELFFPPDVAGWRGGDDWLLTTNLLARCQFAESVIAGLDSSTFTAAAYQPDNTEQPESWVRTCGRQLGLWRLGSTTEKVLAHYAEETLLPTGQKDSGMRGLLQLLMMSPEAQMK